MTEDTRAQQLKERIKNMREGPGKETMTRGLVQLEKSHQQRQQRKVGETRGGAREGVRP